MGSSKKFALRGNVVDLAIGFTVGAAFTTIARSLVDDIIMPPVGLVMGRADFSDLFWVLRGGAEASPPYTTLAEAQAAGAVTVNYGIFINNLIAFLLIALSMFLLVRVVNRVDERLEQEFGAEKSQPGDPAEKEVCLLPVHHPLQGDPLPGLHLALRDGSLAGAWHRCFCSARVSRDSGPECERLTLFGSRAPSRQLGIRSTQAEEAAVNGMTRRMILRGAFLLIVVVALPGCLAAAAAAGAAGAIAYTERGATSLADAPVDALVQRTEAVFAELDIEITERTVNTEDNEVTLKGKRDDMEVTVEIEEQDADTAEVDVYARENLVQWDREFARSVLERIVVRD